MGDDVVFAPVDSDAYPVVRKIKKVHNNPVIGVRMFIDQDLGKYVLVSAAHDSIKVYSMTSFGDEVQLDDPAEYEKYRTGAESFDFHSDNRLMILTDSMNLMHIVEIDSETKLKGKTLDRGFMSCMFNRFIPNSYNVFATSFVHGLTYFDLDGIEIKVQPYERVQSVTSANFSPNGTFLAIGTSSGTVDIFNGLNLNLLCTIEELHLMKIRVVEFTHDEHQLLIGSDDRKLTLHALLEDGPACVRIFRGHRAPVLDASIDYSSNSAVFASCGNDRRVILWNLTTGDPLHEFKKCYDELVTAVRFSLNGEYLVSGTVFGTVVIHRICESYLEEQKSESEEIQNGFGSDREDLQINEDAAIPNISDSDEDCENHEPVNGIGNGINLHNGNFGDGIPEFFADIRDDHPIVDSRNSNQVIPVELSPHSTEILIQHSANHVISNHDSEYHMEQYAENGHTFEDDSSMHTMEQPEHTPEDFPMEPTPQNVDQRMSGTPEDNLMQQCNGQRTPDDDYPME